MALEFYAVLAVQRADRVRRRARDHPGFGAAPRRVEARGVPPGLPEHLLEDVARVGALADDPEDQREHHGRIAVVEDGEGLPVTGSHLPDEIRADRHPRLSLS